MVWRFLIGWPTENCETKYLDGPHKKVQCTGYTTGSQRRGGEGVSVVAWIMLAVVIAFFAGVTFTLVVLSFSRAASMGDEMRFREQDSA